jgi:prepilin-type N-terminal cleavage/methylation domain-containing protein
MKARAFSLIELSVAMAIAGITAAAAITATMSLQKSMVATRKTTEIADDARFTLEHLLGPLRTVGGGLVQPWQAVSNSCVDDGRFTLEPCVAGKTGRLHVARLATPSQCRITSIAGNTITVERPGGVCCLANANTGLAIPGPVLLFPADTTASRAALRGPGWRSRICTPSLALCTCTISAGLTPGFDVTPPGRALVDADFAGGVLGRGGPTTYFVRTSTKHLMALFDVTGTGLAVANELTPRVAGFDSRIGYDRVPADGVIDLPLSATPDATHLDDLRLLRVGLAVATTVPDGRVAGGTLLGVAVNEPGKKVVVAEGNAVVRATGVFQ